MPIAQMIRHGTKRPMANFRKSRSNARFCRRTGEADVAFKDMVKLRATEFNCFFMPRLLFVVFAEFLSF